MMFDDMFVLQAGWTIARAINTGVMYPSSFVGCHAGDHESYTVFQELFYPVIEGYHKGFKVGVSKHHTDMDVSKITTDLTDLAKSKIVSTRIRVARNLAMFPLNPGMCALNVMNACDVCVDDNDDSDDSDVMFWILQAARRRPVWR
jgi:hypothetical protein